MVTKEGITRSAAAAAGDITVPSRPIATDGSPMPATPFTTPAARKMPVNSRTYKTESCIEGSCR
ncbi:hypothetical protein D3C76_1429580 [compost metagenome]